ncbi:type IV secretion system protein [Pseudomonas corrugata]|uniref:type IV secretion system protein n=1 Tax=Pseudomonas corrugata TaxID=47879 RepID=UPI0018E5FD2F|nr:type IV secretion system protein [Pseudomonas corrugata]MBI6621567.1 type IV secretion system protein [Pseudomonas corrugata]MBI6694198.1 type IV secretion system protein [Pseudomonas corrugata]
MGFTMASDIFGSIDQALNQTMSSGISQFASLIAPLIGSCVGLYLVLVAWGWIFNGSNHQPLPVFDLMKKALNMAMFTTFAFNIGHYFTYVVEPANSIGNEISAAFSATGKDAPQVIDQMGNQILDTVQLIWDMAPSLSLTDLNIVPLFRAIGTILIVGVGGVVFMAYSFLYLAIAKIMVALVLCLGPLFISAVFFPATRQFFNLWLNQLLNYILLTALFGITFTLLTNMLQKYVSGSDFSGVLLGDMVNVKLLFCYLLFTGVITAIPALASSLSGGVGINSLGGMSTVASLMKGPAKALLSGIKGMSRAGNTISGGNRPKLG